MAYRKLGRDSKHRRSMLANLTKAVIMNERIETTEDRAKETRKFVDLGHAIKIIITARTTTIKRPTFSL